MTVSKDISQKELESRIRTAKIVLSFEIDGDLTFQAKQSRLQSVFSELRKAGQRQTVTIVAIVG